MMRAFRFESPADKSTDRPTMLKKLVSPAWAILEHGSYPFLLLVATPWFLHQLGTEHYGHWMPRCGP